MSLQVPAADCILCLKLHARLQLQKYAVVFSNLKPVDIKQEIICVKIKEQIQKTVQNPAGDEISCFLYATKVLKVSFIINVL